MTPQQKIKARLREAAGTVDLSFAVRNRRGAIYVTVTGDFFAASTVIQRFFPAAHLTSGGMYDQTFRIMDEPIIDLLLREMVVEPGWLAWHDGTVVRLAEAIRAAAAFDRLPILADALEEAGCTSIAILDHCRTGAPHAHSCWVIDLLLGENRKRGG
jgi:hypothetical protein